LDFGLLISQKGAEIFLQYGDTGFLLPNQQSLPPSELGGIGGHLSP